MVVEVALAHFVNPQPSAENPARQSFDDLHARFDSLERNLRTIAETVALHARYHLAVMLPLPQQQQLEACQLGDERFKVLAEQVDQRVREGRPLLQETIDRLNAAGFGETESTIGEDRRPRPRSSADRPGRRFARQSKRRARSDRCRRGGRQQFQLSALAKLVLLAGMTKPKAESRRHYGHRRTLNCGLLQNAWTAAHTIPKAGA